jgi:Arc/MetJ-type ribon-helix-helix transcriptional regulator
MEKMSHKMDKKDTIHYKDSIKIQTKIHGKPAQWVRQWIDEGYYGTITEAVRQAIYALYEKRLEVEFKNKKNEKS